MEPEAFSPSARGLIQPPYAHLSSRGYAHCVQNPTKSELKQKIYKPRLTLTKRKGHAGFILTLRIEFSAPKLLLGNNFSELDHADFERLLDALHLKLAGMGIRVAKEALRKTPVSAIHYSKNIPLLDFSTCSMVMQELGKINLTQRLDLAKTDYRNEGHAIRCHANSYELVFYDKMKDLQQAGISEKRAIEWDNGIQRDLFSQGHYPRQLEVLRMEVRLGNRTKIKSLLRALGLKQETDFESLFDAGISKRILLHFWQPVADDMPMLALSQFKPEDMLVAMVAESSGAIKPGKLLQKLGWLALAQSAGMRSAKGLLQKHSNPRTWQRLKRELESLGLTSRMGYTATKQVGRCLEAFEPLKIEDYRDKKWPGWI